MATKKTSAKRLIKKPQPDYEQPQDDSPRLHQEQTSEQHLKWLNEGGGECLSGGSGSSKYILKLSKIQIIEPERMAKAVQLNISRTIPTNITSSLGVSPSRSHFASITRQLSPNSSQWIYRLDYYHLASHKKLESIDLYNSYTTDKHFLAFIPSAANGSFIAVATVNNILFYRTDPLTRINSVLHHQANVYDLKASPDGKLVVLVGQTIVMYRTNGFKSVLFPQIVENARFCDFSRDSKYMVIASTSALNLYTYARANDNYQFQPIPLTNFQAPIDYESITSVEFNPRNATQLVVGFLSSSPAFFTLQNGGYFYKKFTDIQPTSSKNAKVARYFPDCNRYYSFDYLDGVGLWPGPNNKLYYKENFLFYDASSNALGTSLIGYVWQQIKVADVLLDCGSGTLAQQCGCPANQTWSYQNYQCIDLVCLQAEHAAGAIAGDSCLCRNGYVWDPLAKKCAIDCASIKNTLPLQPSLYSCSCDNNWSWNALTSRCEFDCTQIAYSTGALSKPGECACLPGFQWSPSTNECQCSPYMQPAGGVCLCYANYYPDEQGRCQANCSAIANAVGPANDSQQCVCSAGYYFKNREGAAGCQLDCLAIKDTAQEYDFSTCLCRQHMDWLNGTCVVNCKVIEFSDSVGLQNNTCACAINYNWQDKIKQCARSCVGVKHTDPKGQPTLQACPCIRYFLWNEANTRCEIQCSQIPNSEVYTLSQTDQCECRSGFVWNNESFSCQVNCTGIWNAKSRLNDSFCTCADDQPFNGTSLTCASTGTAGIFSSELSIAGFVLGCVVVLAILIILVWRFCWKFETESNDEHEKKEHEKKIKGKDPKRRKMARQGMAPPMQDEELKTNERLRTPAKLLTATSL